MANSALAGTASITVDGTTHLLAGDFKYSPSSIKRETLAGMDGVHGYKETYIPGSITAAIRDSGGLTVADFNSMTNSTIVVSLANGKTLIGRNMWTVESQEVDSTEAKFDVKFEGPSLTETTAS
jgi:hypothetical protein